jgi:hypothetical protein
MSICNFLLQIDIDFLSIFKHFLEIDVDFWESTLIHILDNTKRTLQASRQSHAMDGDPTDDRHVYFRYLAAKRAKATRVEVPQVAEAAKTSPSTSVISEILEPTPEALRRVEYVLEGRHDRNSSTKVLADCHPALAELVKPNSTSSGAPAVMWRQLTGEEQERFTSLGEKHIDNPKDMQKPDKEDVGAGGIHKIEGHHGDYFVSSHFRFPL